MKRSQFHVPMKPATLGLYLAIILLFCAAGLEAQAQSQKRPCAGMTFELVQDPENPSCWKIVMPQLNQAPSVWPWKVSIQLLNPYSQNISLSSTTANSEFNPGTNPYLPDAHSTPMNLQWTEQYSPTFGYQFPVYTGSAKEFDFCVSPAQTDVTILVVLYDNYNGQTESFHARCCIEIELKPNEPPTISAAGSNIYSFSECP